MQSPVGAKADTDRQIGLSAPLCRDTGNDFFVPQISGGSVKFPGTLNVV